MNNTFIVAKREFITRAFKKKFIMITLFMPLIIAIFSGSIGYIVSYKNDSRVTIILHDPSGIVPADTEQWANINFVRKQGDLDALKGELDGRYEGIISLPDLPEDSDADYQATYLTAKKTDLETKASLQRFIQVNVKNKRLSRLGLNQDKLSQIEKEVRIREENISGKKDSGSEIAAAIGGIFGFFLYLLLTINGSMIMRSVMEEKTNRIVEVMISTVRPHELMFGKILGVGMVGLFQIIVWCITTPLFIYLISGLFMGGVDMAAMNTGPAGDMIQSEMTNSVMGDIISQLQAIHWWMLIPTIFLFFLLGYLMYSSLFAAIGSTMGDDQGEGQSLTFLVIMPLLFGFYISISALKSPNSSLAVWSSLVPLFSPIVMPVRLAFEPPVWEIITSLVLLALASVFFAWLSARIYRVGILMYGKKASFKDLVRWFRTK